MWACGALSLAWRVRPTVDMFGADDADWLIYRQIVRVFPRPVPHAKCAAYVDCPVHVASYFLQSKEDESDDEEDDLEQLSKLEDVLAKYDPTFSVELVNNLEDDNEGAGRGGGSATGGRLLSLLRYGPASATPAAVADPSSLIARQYQLHLNVERIRVPEVCPTPSSAPTRPPSPPTRPPAQRTAPRSHVVCTHSWHSSTSGRS